MLAKSVDTLVFLLQIFGSLGVFLYGMKVMSEGIQKVSGEGLRALMASMTKNRFLGVFTGFLITCVVQSSSATTVMVVSFVNANLLTLLESIGVIMGANLGTTLTGWIIGLVGKFSLAKIAVPIIGVGLPLLFFTRDRIKSMGEVFIGFGLLFMGLGLLKHSVPDVKSLLSSSNPADLEIVASIQDVILYLNDFGFFSVIIFVVLGILLTLIVQSSSAAMAITITFALQGWINFEIAAAIVLGENIGTTVTAYLASLGTSIHAKRSARAHFLFNMLGVCWMLAVFYPYVHMVDGFKSGSVYIEDVSPAEITAFVEADTDGEYSDESDAVIKKAIVDQNIPLHLALFHTTFNLLNICLMIGFVPMIARVVERWVKVKEGAKGTKSLLSFSSSFLPALSELDINKAENQVESFYSGVQDYLDRLSHAMTLKEAEEGYTLEELKMIGKNGAKFSNEIYEYLIRCSAGELSQGSKSEIASLLRVVAEIEDMFDCCDRVREVVKRRYKNQISFTSELHKNITDFKSSLDSFMEFSSKGILNSLADDEIAEGKVMRKQMTRDLKLLKRDAIARIEDGTAVPGEVLYLDVINNFEKIGIHCYEILRIHSEAFDN